MITAGSITSSMSNRLNSDLLYTFVYIKRAERVPKNHLFFLFVPSNKLSKINFQKQAEDRSLTTFPSMNIMQLKLWFINTHTFIPHGLTRKYFPKMYAYISAPFPARIISPKTQIPKSRLFFEKKYVYISVPEFPEFPRTSI